MGVEGRISIELARRPDGSGEARIESSRPLGIARVFAGTSVEDTVRTVPLLFNVCGMAQGSAAALAAEQALGQAPHEPTRCARLLLVLAETMREHLVRIVSDGAQHVGITPEPTVMLRIMGAYETLRRAIDPARKALEVGWRLAIDRQAIHPALAAAKAVIEDVVTGEPLDRFSARTSPADIGPWHRARMTPAQHLAGTIADRGWAAAGHSDTRFLPALDGGDLARRLLDAPGDAFIRYPTSGGEPHEASVLGRVMAAPLVAALAAQHGHGLLTRLMARVVELVGLPAQMLRIMGGAIDEGTVAEASSPAQRRGIATVEAARGRLVHAVDVEDGRIKRYAILAPTEWNFHPEGAAARGLAAIAAGTADVRPVAALFIGALDPCVSYDLRGP